MIGKRIRERETVRSAHVHVLIRHEEGHDDGREQDEERGESAQDRP